jgi:shikimate kinase
MGSGKSTVGRELADALGWRFVDLDEEIVRRERRSIAETFRTEGEPGFRRIETHLLLEVLRSPAPAVIALGGGTFVQTGNREILRSHEALTVHLDAEFDLLNERCCTAAGTRPLMRDPVHFRNLFEQRRSTYRSAEIVIEIADKSPAQIAAEIIAEVHKGSACRPVSE